MTPATSIEEKAVQLLAADPDTLAPAADNNLIILVTNEFSESGGLAMADFVEATFDGYAPIEVGVGTQPEGLDPATGDYVIDLLAPAGGFIWESTAAPEDPETIKGFVLTNDDKTAFFGSHKFETPYIINSANQRINLGDKTRFRWPKGLVS